PARHAGQRSADAGAAMSTSFIGMVGEMTIYDAAAQKERLLGAVDDGDGALQIDLSGVSELDLAGLQILMLAKRRAQRRGREMNLVGHSPAVLEVFELANVAAFFGDPLVIDGPPHA